MKRKTKRALSMVLASSMMLSVSSYTAFGASFRDTTGHWAENQVNIWSDYGVINGYDGLFRPDDSITRGEMAVIMDKVMKYQVSAENTFNDLDQNFYTESILKANQAGIMRGSDGAVRPKDNITREEASVLICQAFGIDPVEESTSKFNDSDQVSSWAAGYVNALSQKGYISGKGNNNFDPKGNITRGEAVTMFNNIVKGFYHQAGTYTQNITGNVVVNTPDTTLKDMSVTGDIFITEGVGDGDLTLENVVASNVVVRGGGVNSIKIRGNSQIGNIRVEKKDSDVRVAVDGTAKVDSVYVKEGSKNSVLEGPLGKVEVASSNSIVRMTGATVKELNVTEKTAHVIIDEKSKVENINVAETAVNAVVEINGVVVNLNVNAASSSITTGSNSKIDNVSISEKATNVKLDIAGVITNLTTAAQSTIMNIAEKAVVSTLKIFEKATNSALTVAGKVNSILVDAANAIIEVLKGGEVGTIESSSTATGLEVKGEGKVSSITVGGNDSKITISNAYVKVESEVKGTVVNGNDVAGGEDVTTGSGSDVTPGEVVNPGGEQTVDPNDPDDPANYDDDDEEEQAAPTGIDGVRPKTLANIDGMLKNTTTDMEYKLSTDSSYTECLDDETPVPTPGTYDVRYKASEGKLASPDTKVEVKAFDILDAKIEILPENIEELKIDGEPLDFSKIEISVEFDTEEEDLKKKTYTLQDLEDNKDNPEYPKFNLTGFNQTEPSKGIKEATIELIGYNNKKELKFNYKVLNNAVSFDNYSIGDGTPEINDHTIIIKNVKAKEELKYIPTFEVPYGAVVKVDGQEHKSGESEVDFGNADNLNSIVYSVTAEDGVKTEEWTVSIELKVPVYELVEIEGDTATQTKWCIIKDDEGNQLRDFLVVFIDNSTNSPVRYNYVTDETYEDAKGQDEAYFGEGYSYIIWDNKDIAEIWNEPGEDLDKVLNLISNTNIKRIFEGNYELNQ